jgi:hypothetical protein
LLHFLGTAGGFRFASEAHRATRHATMTCRIDRLSNEQGVVLRMSGRITGEGVDVLRRALEKDRVLAVDLTDVDLVDRDAVTVLARTEEDGIELRHCPAYIREWVTRERGRR